jgi:transcriptional regulator with XRE-family HTH domain
MAKNFKELRAKMSEGSRAKSAVKAQGILKEMALSELREAMKLTQESLADTLNVKQASISKMERRSDMYLSTLRKIVEAMGGNLEIIANMPDGRVRISQFREIRARKSEAPQADIGEPIAARA